MDTRLIRYGLLGAALLYYVFFHAIPTAGQSIHGDFPSFYLAAWMAAEEDTPPYDPEALRAAADRVDAELLYNRPIHPFLYLPPMLVFFAPFAWVSYSAAQTALFLMNQVLIAAMLALVLWGVLRARPDSWIVTGAIVYTLVFQPLHMTISSGQVNLAVLTLLLLFWAGVRRGWHPAATSLTLALAIVLKTYPAVFLLLLLLRKRYAELLWAGAWLLAIAVLTLPMLPEGTWAAWNGNVGAYGGYGVHPPALHHPAAAWNQSLNGFFARAFSGGGFHEPLAEIPALARWLPYPTALAILGLSAWAVLCGRDDESRFDWAFSLFLLTMFLLAPYSWEHHLVLVLPCFALLANRALHSPGPARVGTLIAIGLLLMLPFPWSTGRFYDQASIFQAAVPSLLVSVKLAAALALWTWTLLEARSAQHE